jgi:hypothetical protein
MEEGKTGARERKERRIGNFKPTREPGNKHGAAWHRKVSKAGRSGFDFSIKTKSRGRFVSTALTLARRRVCKRYVGTACRENKA